MQDHPVVEALEQRQAVREVVQGATELRQEAETLLAGQRAALAAELAILGHQELARQVLALALMTPEERRRAQPLIRVIRM